MWGSFHSKVKKEGSSDCHGEFSQYVCLIRRNESIAAPMSLQCLHLPAEKTTAAELCMSAEFLCNRVIAQLLGRRIFPVRRSVVKKS
jgi:hypothetical protein